MALGLAYTWRTRLSEENFRNYHYFVKIRRFDIFKGLGLLQAWLLLVVALLASVSAETEIGTCYSNPVTPETGSVSYVKTAGPNTTTFTFLVGYPP